MIALESEDGFALDLGVAGDGVNGSLFRSDKVGFPLGFLGEIGGEIVAVIPEGKLRDDGFGLAGEVKSTVVEGIGAVEIKLDLGFRFLEDLGLAGNRFGKGREAVLEGGDGGRDLLRLKSGTVAPSFEKTSAVTREVKGMECDPIWVRMRKENIGRLGIDDANGLGKRRRKSGPSRAIGLIRPDRFGQDGVSGDQEFRVLAIPKAIEAAGFERLLEEEARLRTFQTEAAVLVASTENLVVEGARHDVLGPHILRRPDGIRIGVGIRGNPNFAIFETPPHVQGEVVARFVAISRRHETIGEEGIIGLFLFFRRSRHREGCTHC